MKWIRGIVLGQLRRPHGWLAPLMGWLLDRANQRLNARVIDMLDPRPGERILEIGFGGGMGIEVLQARCPQVRLAGVEISTAMLAVARRRYRRAVATGFLELREASVERLPWPDACFDGVYTVNTIYFWPDAMAGPCELHRVLRPGLSREVTEKLTRIRPCDLGMASRIPGVTPASLMALRLYLEMQKVGPRDEED